MDSIKLMDDNSFYEKQYYKNLQKNQKKETFANNFLIKSREKKNHTVDKFTELFSNLYPENSSRVPGRAAGIIKKFTSKNSENLMPFEDDKFKNYFKRKKK
jgi:hypothetical protein